MVRELGALDLGENLHVAAEEGAVALEERGEDQAEAIVERIVEGRIEKFLDEFCLLRQVYIRDDAITVEKLLLQTIAAIGENLIIRRFARWELGENLQ